MMNPPKLSREVVEFEYERVRSLIEPHFSEAFAGYYLPRGWMYIVERLHKELMSIHPTYKVEQVKEKYGTLRFYVEHPLDDELDDKITALIFKYEDESAITCEECGSSSAVTQQVGGWLFTVCAGCSKGLHKEFRSE